MAHRASAKMGRENRAKEVASESMKRGAEEQNCRREHEGVTTNHNSPIPSARMARARNLSPARGGRRRGRPLFPDRTRQEWITMLLVTIGNGLFILGTAFHVGAGLLEGRIAWWLLLLLLPVALFVGDFATGFVHWAVDTWFDERSLGRLVMIAREHHTHPTHVLHYGFLEHATLGSTIVIPAILPLWGAAQISLPSAAALAVSFLCCVVALCLFFGTTLHNLGHRRSRSAILRFLQRSRLLISPAYHAVHHRPPQTVRYCVVNGWADTVCDRFGVWRGLERVITRLTGAIPRQDDEDWQRRWPERLARWRARRTKEKRASPAPGP